MGMPSFEWRIPTFANKIIYPTILLSFATAEMIIGCFST